MTSVTVRYIVDDVDAAIDFYCRHLGFREQMHPAPAFAMLVRGDLRLLLSAPNGQGGGGQTLADGRIPEPGGWNRFSLEVADLAAVVEGLRQAGARFRSDVIEGVGGRQILVDDPSGNRGAVRAHDRGGLAVGERLITRGQPSAARHRAERRVSGGRRPAGSAPARGPPRWRSPWPGSRG